MNIQLGHVKCFNNAFNKTKTTNKKNKEIGECNANEKKITSKKVISMSKKNQIYTERTNGK